jgi:hypothetical protein
LHQRASSPLLRAAHPQPRWAEAKMRISEKISKMAQSPSVVMGHEVEMSFLEKRVGSKFIGLPINSMHQDQYIVKGNEVTIQLVKDPNGKSMIKACADPVVFDENYPNQITGTMTGRESIGMILVNPEVDGILLCSATSFHSYPIYRERCMELVDAQGASEDSDKPWWKFW